MIKIRRGKMTDHYEKLKKRWSVYLPGNTSHNEQQVILSVNSYVMCLDGSAPGGRTCTLHINGRIVPCEGYAENLNDLCFFNDLVGYKSITFSKLIYTNPKATQKS